MLVERAGPARQDQVNPLAYGVQEDKRCRRAGCSGNHARLPGSPGTGCKRGMGFRAEFPAAEGSAQKRFDLIECRCYNHSPYHYPTVSDDGIRAWSFFNGYPLLE